ncbi:MAG TPA: LysR substrate-binding domain-containing protein [Azospirillum sp.]|nr:LysR substrate-binding domain-containing protein [Azospirillum sp.]
MRIPPFAALRAFEAVSRHKSVRKAAEELGVDHTVVSRHLRALQAVMDVQLVLTSRQGVALTAAGNDYAAVLTPAFAEIAAATTRLMREGRSANLTIWCLPGFAMRWLTPRLPDFHRRHPGVEISLRPSEVRPDLANFEADGEIHYGEPKEAGLRHAVLARPRVFPVASPSWLVAHPAATRVAGLPAMPLIHEESHRQWLDWFAAAGVPLPERLRGPRLWHAHLAVEAAKLGQGVALANELIAATEIAAGELTEIGATNVVLNPYVFVTRRDRWNEPAISRFRRWLLRQFSQDAAPVRPVAAGA